MPNKGIPRPHWTDDEDAIVVETYPDVDSCIKKLAKTGSHRNRDSVMRRAKKLGLNETMSNRPWTETEDKILMDNYSKVGAEAVVDMLADVGIERTQSAVLSRASALGVKRGGNVDGRWTDEEVEIVKEFYPIGGVAAVERELLSHGYERSRSAINSRVQIVGARKEPVRRTERAGDIKVINFVVDTIVDRDLIEHLGKFRNRSEYLRGLITADMGRSQ